MNTAIREACCALMLLWALVAGWPMASPCQAAEKPLRAIAIDAGFDEADCSYHSITLGSDERIYFSMSGHRIDKNAHFCCYDPRPEKVVFTREISESLKDEDTARTVPQGKVHSGLMEADKKIYFSTHVGYYKDDRKGRGKYPGFHFMHYDMRTDKLVDMVRGPEGEGMLATSLDSKRLILYGLTYPSSLLFKYDIKADKLTQLAYPHGDSADFTRSFNSMNITRVLALDPEGTVYGSCLDGSIWRLDERDKPVILPRVNTLQGLSGMVDDLGRLNNNWRAVLWDERDRCFYGTHMGTQSLFRFDPASLKIRPVTRLSAQAFRNTGHTYLSKTRVPLSQLGFAMGPERTLYHIVHGQPIRMDGRSEYNTAARLVTYGLDDGMYKDHGPIFCQGDRRVTFAESILLHPNGDIYTVGSVEVIGDQHNRFKQLRQIGTAGETRGEVYKIMLVRIPNAVELCQRNEPFVKPASPLPEQSSVLTGTRGPAVSVEPVKLPAREKFHLFLLIGQSNMAGRGAIEEQDRTPHPRVFMLNQAGEWAPAVDPLHFDKPEAGTGLGKTFGVAIAESNSEIAVGLIPCAVGGSPIGSWKPGEFYPPTKSCPWDDAIRRAGLAIKSGVLKGILWHQGESDSKDGLASVYEVKLHDLIMRLRSEFAAPEVPFIVGQMGLFPDRPWDEARQQVDLAHRDLPGKVSNTAFVNSVGLQHKGDKVHFDSPSCRILGMRFAEAFIRLTGGEQARATTSQAIHP